MERYYRLYRLEKVSIKSDFGEYSGVVDILVPIYTVSIYGDAERKMKELIEEETETFPKPLYTIKEVWGRKG